MRHGVSFINRLPIQLDIAAISRLDIARHGLPVCYAGLQPAVVLVDTRVPILSDSVLIKVRFKELYWLVA